MAGVHQHRQVGGLFQNGDGGGIQCGPCGGQAALHTALAQDHLLIAAGEDILRRQQEFLHRGGQTPLQHHRAAQLAQRLQQRVVLHIPGAHLQDVHVLQQRELGYVGDLRDYGQTGVTARLHQQLHTDPAQSLKRIRGGAGLEGTAPQHLCAEGFYRLSHGGDLRGGFHGTGACNEAEALTDAGIARADHGVGGMGGAPRQPVGRRQTAHLLHEGQRLQNIGVETPCFAHQRQQDGFRAGHAAALDVLHGELRQKLADRRLRSPFFDDDDHVRLLY